MYLNPELLQLLIGFLLILENKLGVFSQIANILFGNAAVSKGDNGWVLINDNIEDLCNLNPDFGLCSHQFIQHQILEINVFARYSNICSISLIRQLRQNIHPTPFAPYRHNIDLNADFLGFYRQFVVEILLLIRFVPVQRPNPNVRQPIGAQVDLGPVLCQLKGGN